MNINSINQTMSLYNSIPSRNITPFQTNSVASHYNMNSCDILNNYNSATINFRGKNPLEKVRADLCTAFMPDSENNESA